MLREHRLAAWLCMATLALGATCAPETGRAQRGAITSVAVGSTGALSTDPALGPALRSALADELGDVGNVRVTSRGRARYIVRGSVTRLERQSIRGRTHIECEVSLIIAGRRDGAVKLMLSGRATAQGAPSLEDAVLRAAVRGALRPLGPALPRLR